MTGSDVAGLVSAINSKDGDDTFANNWIWIIGLLIIAGIFSGGNGFFGGGNSNSATTQDFIQRDIFNTNTAVLTGNAATQNEILNNRYNDSQNYSNLRYDSATGLAAVDKNVMLGQQAIQSQMANNALQSQASMDSCCCTLRSEMRDQIQSVKDLINANTIQDLRDAKAGYELVAALGNQTNTISSRFGTFYPNPPYNPYYNYGTYGTTIV